MMQAKARTTARLGSPWRKSSPLSSAGKEKGTRTVEENKWEVRPGGMLVQKRVPDSDAAAVPIPTIRVKVKHNGVYHEIYISAQATFGELKKMVAAKTGQHPDDQKVVFKSRERQSKAFLDTAGVKDRSKLVMLEDPTAKAQRLLEQRRTEKSEKATKSISRIGVDVDKLASKVAALEKIAGNGGRVVESDIVALTESLMTELIKLDTVAVDGDLKAQRTLLEKRVQKYVETLDFIKARNSAPKTPDERLGNAEQTQLPKYRYQQPGRRENQLELAPTKVASWETFDLLSSPSSTTSTANTPKVSASVITPNFLHPPPHSIPKFDWELF